MTSIKAIFTGFDSAWTDNAKKPGAIASIILDADGSRRLMPPEPATFDHARNSIFDLSSMTSLHIVGIDQPTIVPNDTGSRPVDKVVASLISKMKGGVQPANRSKTVMFGDDAAIWPFLESIPHAQCPASAVGADKGQVIMEVFPALAILGLFPRYIERGRQPKYNPERRKTFELDDWRSLVKGLALYGNKAGIDFLPEWARSMSTLPRPLKADQDAVDAVICAIQAFHWWQWGFEKSAVIGDEKTGYIVGVTSDWTMEYLKAQAEKRSVPFQRRW
jgi:predicted RNase H-like nuclease